MKSLLKGALIEQTKFDEQIDIAELEERLNCAVVHGFGLEADIPTPLGQATAVVDSAIYWVFGELVDTHVRPTNQEPLQLVVFSDSVQETLFELQFGPSYAKFAITSDTLQRMNEMTWALEEAQQVYSAIRDLREALAKCKAGQLNVAEIATDIDAWINSLEQRAEDVGQTVYNRSSALVELLRSGW